MRVIYISLVIGGNNFKPAKNCLMSPYGSRLRGKLDIRKGSVFKLMLGLCGRYWSEGTRPRRRDKAQETELDIRGKKDARYL